MSGVARLKEIRLQTDNRTSLGIASTLHSIHYSAGACIAICPLHLQTERWSICGYEVVPRSPNYSPKTGMRPESPRANIHVVPRTAGWAVRREGTSSDISYHLTQADAIDVGRAVAAREGVELFRYSRTGEVRETDAGWSPPPT